MPSTDHIFRMYADQYCELRSRYQPATENEVLRRALQYVALCRVCDALRPYDMESRALIAELMYQQR